MLQIVRTSISSRGSVPAGTMFTVVRQHRCVHSAQVPVDHAVPLRERGVEVRMEFGGTEIAVSCYKQHDGDKLLDAKVGIRVRQ